MDNVREQCRIRERERDNIMLLLCLQCQITEIIPGQLKRVALNFIGKKRNCELHP